MKTKLQSSLFQNNLFQNYVLIKKINLKIKKNDVVTKLLIVKFEKNILRIYNWNILIERIEWKKINLRKYVYLFKKKLKKNNLKNWIFSNNFEL